MSPERKGLALGGLLVRRLLEAGVLALVFAAAFRWPAASGNGVVEALAALLFPPLLMEGLLRGRSPWWSLLALFGGFALLFHWVPATLAAKGNLALPVAFAGALLLAVYEAAGLLLVALLARWGARRRGPWAAGLCAALGIVLWEALAFHVYLWSWGAAFGGLPWLARAAAFLGSHGLAALAWGCGAFAAARLAEGKPQEALAPVLAAPLVLALLGGAWYLLPREAPRSLDVVMVQPGFPAGQRLPGMEARCWMQTDEALARAGLPRAGRATLVLWPESSVLGRDDRVADPRLPREAASRGIAWLYGTEGGPFNLVRGEAPGRPSFLFAKAEPMAFGERMPGPAPVRAWLDRSLGFLSQEPGRLDASASFCVPGAGDLRVHPLVCSEAMRPGRVQAGLAAAGGELLANLTNDGWFEHSVATDLHAAQVRLRAVEACLPLLRATLTGRSGLFREDGAWVLWGAPMTRDTYSLALDWRPVRTPARHAAWTASLLALLTVAALAACLWRRRP